MFSSGEKMVDVAGFKIPKDQAKKFIAMREKTAKEASKVLSEFCVKVERKQIDDVLGEGVVGYNTKGEEEARVTLDPFEVPAMDVAIKRGKLLEYILAANGLTMPYYEHLKSLLAEFKESAE